MTDNIPSKKALEKSAKIISVFFGAIGFVCFAIGGFTLALPWSFVAFVFGVMFLGLGVYTNINGGEYAEAYLAKKATNDPVESTKKTLKEFNKDKSGIVWVWIVALLAWGIMAIAYFALSVVVYMVLDSVEAMPYAYPQAYLDNITLTRNVTGWFLVIMTIGILGWALISSVRKVDDTSPAY